MKNKETLEDKRTWINLKDKVQYLYPEKDVKRFIQEFIDEVEDDMFHEICWDVTEEEEKYSPSYFAFRNKLIRKIIKKYEKRINKLAKQKFGGLVE